MVCTLPGKFGTDSGCGADTRLEGARGAIIGGIPTFPAGGGKCGIPRLDAVKYPMVPVPPRTKLDTVEIPNEWD